MENVSDYQSILIKIKDYYTEILKENLTGIYVHGSIAFNCFNWDKSDVDFIVVIDKPISNETKLKLMDATIQLNQMSPAKGIEMSIVLKKYCLEFLYPTPFELHFSNAHYKWYKDNPIDYCEKMLGEDKDLAAHFTVIRKVGITLYGAEISNIFSPVPISSYLDSIKSDIENAREEIVDNPIYITLNLCRVLAYLKEGLVLSKEQGGKWGIKHLESSYENLISEAFDCYISDKTMRINKGKAFDFSTYMLKQIFDAY